MPRRGRADGGDKKENPLASMFNLDMPDDDEEALMAELAALQGIAPAKKSKKKPQPDKSMPLDQLLAQSAALMNDEDLDGDEGDMDDDEDLMAELGDLLGDDDDDSMLAEIADTMPAATPPVVATPQKRAPAPVRPAMPAPQYAPAKPQNSLSVALERREVYLAMLEKSKAAGETSKVRRYDRVLKQCDTAIKTLKSGRPFDISTLPEPPPGFVPGKQVQQPSAAPQPAPVPQPTLTQPANENLPFRKTMQVTSLSDTTTCNSFVPVEHVPTQEAESNASEMQAPLPNMPKPGQLNVNVVDLLNAMEKVEEANKTEHKVDNVVVNLLKERGAKYRAAALSLHKQGRSDEAKSFLNISKQFEAALNGYMLGDDVDLSLIPPDPTEQLQKADQGTVTPPAATNRAPASPPHSRQPGVLVSDEQATIVALNFRLDAYKQQQEKAKAEGNGSKARRLGRVIAQCEGVIKAVKLKRPVDFSVLPELPGAEPIPLPPYMGSSNAGVKPTAVQPLPQSQPASQPAPQPAPAQPVGGGDTLGELHKRMLFLTEAAEKAKAAGNSSKQRRMVRMIEQHQLIVKAVKARKPYDASTLPDIPGFEPLPVPDYMRGAGAGPSKASTMPAPSSNVATAQPARSMSVKEQVRASQADKNLQVLITRQAEYKQEAMKLYKSGDQVGAKKYLAQAKGFDQMIDASQKGLPVDMSKIPPSLSSPPARHVLSRQNTLPHMSGDVIDMGPSGDAEEMYEQLVKDLENQIELCKNNAQVFQKLGDLPSAKHYAQQFQNQTKDLANLKGIYKQRKGIPPYRYEGCKFPILKCCPELSDSEAELVIVRCLNIPVPQGWKPDDLKVHVSWEFSVGDSSSKGSTKTYKGGINPDIFEQFRIDIGNRAARSFARAIKRGSLKATIYYDRGFLKKAGEIGVATVKVADWENLAEIHEAVSVMDGRKQTATKLEVKLRIREPVGGAQCEFTDMRWLIIGKSGNVPSNPAPSLAPPKQAGGRRPSPNVRRRQ